MNDSNTYPCPICHTTLKAIPRYPNYVCRECAARATDKEGRKLRFGNVDASGGYRAGYADTGEDYYGSGLQTLRRPIPNSRTGDIGEVYDSHGIGHPNLLYRWGRVLCG